MTRRKPLPPEIENKVLIASTRRCCLCVFLDHRDTVRKGQIAHLSHNPNDHRFDNLVWLCLDHHDDYDGRTSQSKGFKAGEVRAYRNRLYDRHDLESQRHRVETQLTESVLEPGSDYETLRARFPRELDYLYAPWRYALWQVANQPELFAYKAGNRMDGICLVERIDLPDRRIVMAIIQVAGNPGNSITNTIETICYQLCERFELPPDRVVWLEHYDDYVDDEWSMVTFRREPPDRPFEDPAWEPMTPELWKDLRLRPKRRLTQKHGTYQSKLIKRFHWPTEALL
jgi:hypothetical protein